MFGIILKFELFSIQQYHNWNNLSKWACAWWVNGEGSEEKCCKIFDDLLKMMLWLTLPCLGLFVRVNAVGRHVTTKWTITQNKACNEFIQIQQGGGGGVRLFSESPLIQSLTKERKVSPLCYCFQMTLSFWCWVPPPPSNYSHKNKIITSSVIAMFRCLLKVEVWIKILIQCVWTSYTQSPNIAHFETFIFLPFPKFTPPAHTPFKKSYQICYGLIGNYPSFKMIPNTTYIVLVFKKYNRSKSSLLTLWAGNIFRWRWCVYKKTKTQMYYVCQYCVVQCSWDMQGTKYLVVVLCKWTILDNKCINIHTALS